MLTALSIRDIVLIEKLDIDFSGGMSVLTGETGAGKSILLDSLALALGARGDAGLVRQGQTQGQISAIFEVPLNHVVRKIISENDISCDSEIILRRIQANDGRTRAYINDQPVSATLLKTIGLELVEIHGQHDERALVDSANHRNLLDAYGGLEKDVTNVRTASKNAKKLIQDFDELQQRIESNVRESEFLRSSVEELSKLAPIEGEEEELAERRQQMMQIEKIASDIVEINEYLNGTVSPIPELSSVVRRIERKVDQAEKLLAEPTEKLSFALNYLEEARGGFETALHATEFDPKELEQTEERLFKLRAASRKFSVPVNELMAEQKRMESDLAEIENIEENLSKHKIQMKEAKKTYDKLAQQLSNHRKEVAKKLEQVVAKELPDLKLENAKFMVNILSDESKLSDEGIDQVEFRVQTNPGTREGPLMKVASGGELSRFLLALKVSLADRGSAPTLVFDEIDSGVGGAVSDAIGVRLAKLAENVQVLTVTHAPQVAARASQHFVITKEKVAGNNVTTNVEKIEKSNRREEIARMLAGSKISEEARAAADRLISE